jgi:hypothetical protein
VHPTDPAFWGSAEEALPTLEGASPHSSSVEDRLLIVGR